MALESAAIRFTQDVLAMAIVHQLQSTAMPVTATVSITGLVELDFAIKEPYVVVLAPRSVDSTVPATSMAAAATILPMASVFVRVETIGDAAVPQSAHTPYPHAVHLPIAPG